MKFFNQRRSLFGFLRTPQSVRAWADRWPRPLAEQVRYLGRFIVHLWDHLVPSERNQHKPHALKHRVLVGYSVFLILLKVVAIVAPIALPSSSLYSSAITPQNIIDLTNQTRQNLGLVQLSPNELLASAAQAKADDMVVAQYFAHTSPSGRTPWSWLQQVGYRYAYAGENLAVHFASAEGVLEGWLASPSHRANIVHPRYQEIGVGIARGTFEGFDTTMVVQMFGSPVAAVAAASAQPPSPPPAPAAPPAAALEPAPVQPAVSGEASAPAPPAAAASREAPAIAVTPEAAHELEQSAPAAPMPVVYDASLKAVRTRDGYDVRLMVTGAASVVVRYAGAAVPLRAEAVPAAGVASGVTWSGSVPVEVGQLSRGGDLLTVTAISRDGVTVDRPLAWLAPSVPTQQLYTFNEGADRFTKFFGSITVHNLNDSVKQFYLYFVVFLVAALLLNIFIKVRIQHASIISHTALVIALALLLSIV